MRRYWVVLVVVGGVGCGSGPAVGDRVGADVDPSGLDDAGLDDARDVALGTGGVVEEGSARGSAVDAAVGADGWGMDVPSEVGPTGCVPLGEERCDGVDDDCNGVVDDVPGVGAACDNQRPGACFAGGTMRCEAGHLGCSAAPFGEPVTEICDGLDNDCNGLLDDVPGAGGLCFLGTGLCATSGSLGCDEHGVLACTALDGGGSALPEICDGLDDDCNGLVDDVSGAGEACQNGLAGICFAAGVMVCAPGGLVCDAPTGNAASLEVCNGLDDDCNGSVDDVIGSGAACLNGALGVCQVVGELVCHPSGQLTCGAPVGGALAHAEVCDGLDNDCDGLVDDVLGVGEGCDNGRLGVCFAAGAWACGPAGLLVCTAGDPVTPSAEVCDGLDNDCDGLVDDVAGGGAPCNNGMLGVCHAAGVVGCVGGAVGCELVGGGGPSAEVCDGLDNDCNGLIDDLLGAGEGCVNGDLGVCAAAGVLGCQPDGAFGCSAESGAAAAFAEGCDGLDNDCDGLVDNLPGAGAGCDNGLLGACLRTGVMACGGGPGLVCSAGAVAGQPEQCNGVDDDCDGATDEDLGLGAACNNGLLGACLRAGVTVCDGEVGAVVCAAPAVAPDVERCDGLDDDCDGLTDNVAGVGEVCSLGVGACEASGYWVCDLGSGAAVCDAAIGMAGAEVCDGVDNDCDGVTDESPACAVALDWTFSFGLDPVPNDYALSDAARIGLVAGEAVLLAPPPAGPLGLSAPSPAAGQAALDGALETGWTPESGDIGWLEADLGRMCRLDVITVVTAPGGGERRVEWSTQRDSPPLLAVARSGSGLAERAQDGDLASRWEPGLVPAVEAPWLELDFGAATEVGALTLRGLVGGLPTVMVSETATGPDWAAGRPVVGSRVAGLGAAVDGSLETAWSPGAAPDAWLQVDLGQSRAVSGVRLDLLAAGLGGFEVAVGEEGAGPDVAAGAQVAAFGADPLAAFPAAAAIDGDYGTEWRAGTASGPVGLELDLGEPRWVGALEMALTGAGAAWVLERSDQATSPDLWAGAAAAATSALPGFEAGLAVDGLESTAWVSAMPATALAPQVLSLDRGGAAAIGAVAVRFVGAATPKWSLFGAAGDESLAGAVLLGSGTGAGVVATPGAVLRRLWLVIEESDGVVGVSRLSAHESLFDVGAEVLWAGDSGGAVSASVAGAFEPRWARYVRVRFVSGESPAGVSELRLRAGGFDGETVYSGGAVSGRLALASFPKVAGRFVRVRLSGASGAQIARLGVFGTLFGTAGLVEAPPLVGSGPTFVWDPPLSGRALRLVWPGAVALGEVSARWRAFEGGALGGLSGDGEVMVPPPGSVGRYVRVREGGGEILDVSVVGQELGIEPQTVTTQMLVASGAVWAWDQVALSGELDGGTISVGWRTALGAPFEPAELPLAPLSPAPLSPAPLSLAAVSLAAVPVDTGTLQLRFTLTRGEALGPSPRLDWATVSALVE